MEAGRAALLERGEIIVVDDCSEDGTRIVLQQRLPRVVDRIIYPAVNRGEGVLLRGGFFSPGLQNPLATRVATFGARAVSLYDGYVVLLSRRLESVLGR